MRVTVISAYITAQIGIDVCGRMSTSVITSSLVIFAPANMVIPSPPFQHIVVGSDCVGPVYIQGFRPYLDIGYAVSASNFYKFPFSSV